MDDIRRVIRRARVRLALQSALGAACVTLTLGVGAVLAARLLDRLWGVPIAWDRLLPAVGLGAVLAAAGWAVGRRRSAHAAAQTLDERAQLRDALATALAVQREPDAWSRAVVESARARARQLRVREALPWSLPPAWWCPLAAGLALMVVWFAVPKLEREPGRAEPAATARVEEVVERARAAEQSIQQILAEAGAEALVDAPEAPEADATPEQVERAAIRRLSALAERIEQQMQGERAQTAQDLARRLEQLRQPGPGPLNEMSRALARGEFARARAELDRLAQQLAQQGLSPEAVRQLGQQLEGLARQMEALAQDRAGLEQALQRAGMSAEQARQLAASPEALQRALRQMPTLTDEQRRQLGEMARAMAQSGQAMSAMAGAMAQMAQGAGSEGMGEQGMAGLDQLAEQLGELEMLAQEMMSMDAALAETMSTLQSMGLQLGEQSWSQCQGGLGSDQGWARGASGGQGAGIGSGGSSPEKAPGPEEWEMPYEVERQRAAVRAVQGRIIASRLVFGEQVRGESAAEFQAAAAAASAQAADAIETNLVPRAYQNAVKHYFGRLERAAEPAPAGGAAPVAAPPAEGG